MSQHCPKIAACILHMVRLLQVKEDAEDRMQSCDVNVSMRFQAKIRWPLFGDLLQPGVIKP